MQHADIVTNYSASMENVLLILNALQKKNPQSFLTEEDLRWVADYLNVTCSQIYGLISYYTLFSLKRRGRHILRVCRSPVCQMLGADRIFGQIKRALNISSGDTTSDGLFTLEATECIGQCQRAPCMSVDHTVYGGAKLVRMEDILKIYQKPR